MASTADSTPASAVHPIPKAADVPPPFEPITDAPDAVPLGEAAADVVEHLAQQREEAKIIYAAEALEQMIRHDDELWSGPKDYDDGSPELDECHASTRRVRDASEALAEREAETAEAVAAKAGAIMVAIGDKPDGWYGNMSTHVPLIVSTLADAALLPTRSVAAPAASDAALLDLIERHERAFVIQERADNASVDCHTEMMKAYPPRPVALYWRLDDNFGIGRVREPTAPGRARLYYADVNIAELRKLVAETGDVEPPSKDDGMIGSILKRSDARRAARAREVIDAADQWKADIAAHFEISGLNAANAAVEAASEIAIGIENEVIATVPNTGAGWIAKAQWLLDKDWGTEHLGRLALRMVQDIAKAPAMTMPAQAPIDTQPSREVLETYRTFLEMELRFLNREMGLRDQAALGFWLDNPAGRLHGNGDPGPSTRATPLLRLFGLMPEVPVAAEPAVEAAA